MVYYREDSELHEQKLKKVVKHLNNVIENLEKRKREPNLLDELILLYKVMEIVELEGDYPYEIGQRVENINKKINLSDEYELSLKNYEYVLGDMINYKNRMKNDIFSENFYNIEESSHVFRIEPLFLGKKINKESPRLIIRIAKSPLEALVDTFEEYGEFHLVDPRTSVIRITDCPHLRISKGRGYLDCTCNLLNDKCELTHARYIELCPNENLYRKNDPLLNILEQLEHSS